MTTTTSSENPPATATSQEERDTPPQTEAWHALSLAEAFERLQANDAQGLTMVEAAQRLTQYGPNTLAQARERSAWSILVAQFQSIIVALLVVATVIAFAMGEATSPRTSSMTMSS